MKNIVIFGGGPHANVCIDIFEQNEHFNIVGIIDAFANKGTQVHGYKVIGKQEDIIRLSKVYNIDCGFIAVGDNLGRRMIRDEIIYKIPKFEFVNAIHPNAIIGRNVKIGIGVFIMAGVIISPNAIIGDFCILNVGAKLGHDSILGEFSLLSSGSIVGGKVIIERFCSITLGVTIVDRISIGENTLIGAGAVVLKDLPDNVLAYGNPAKIVKEREFGERFLKSG